jgi:hypothetical protein
MNKRTTHKDQLNWFCQEDSLISKPELLKCLKLKKHCFVVSLQLLTSIGQVNLICIFVDKRPRSLPLAFRGQFETFQTSNTLWWPNNEIP